MRMVLMAASVLLIMTSSAIGQGANELAPNGTLRVGVLLSNPVLVRKTAEGKLAGVSLDLGQLLAAKLAARYEVVPYQTTEAFAKSFGSAEWDIAVGPKTPIAEKTVDLSPAFMLVDNIFVAARGRVASGNVLQGNGYQPRCTKRGLCF